MAHEPQQTGELAREQLEGLNKFVARSCAAADAFGGIGDQSAGWTGHG